MIASESTSHVRDDVITEDTKSAVWGWIQDVERSTNFGEEEQEPETVERARRSSMKKRLLRSLPEVKALQSAMTSGGSPPVASPSRLSVEQCFEILRSPPQLVTSSVRPQTTTKEEP